MAGASVIGALRVVLGADTAALDKGLKESQSGLAAFGSAITGGMAAAAAAVAAAAIAMGAALNRTIDDFDKLSKTSAKLGIPIEQLSSLAYAADLSDVSFEELSKSVAKLSKNMIEAAAKPTSEAANAFRALGVSVLDANGKVKSSDQVLGDIAEKFSGLKDGAGKTAVAMAIFGKAGADMIPMLNDGRDGLKEMNDEAAQFGIIVDAKSGKAAEDFNDNLTRLGYAVKGVFVGVAKELLPALVDLSNGWVESAKKSSVFSTAVTVIADAFKGVITGGIILTSVLTTLGELISTRSQALLLLAKGDFKGAWEAVTGAVTDVGKNAEEAYNRIAKLWGNAKEGADGAAESTGKADKAQKDFNYSAMAGKTAVDQFLDSQKKKIAQQDAETQTVGKGVGEQAKMRVELEATAVATANRIAVTEQLRAKIAAVGDAAAATALKLQGAQLIEQSAMPWDQRAQQVQQYTAAMTAAGATADQLGITMLKIQFPQFAGAAMAAQDFGANIDRLVTDSISGLSSALASVIMGTKSAAEAFKAFALQVITQLIEMIIKAVIFKAIMLALGFSEGGAVGGGTGLSLTGTGGLYADGGNVMGPGTGTSDSIPAMLSNGEFVVNADATKQWGPLLNAINSGKLPAFADGGNVSQQPLTQPTTGTGHQTIIMQGFMWGRDQVRDMFAAINEGMRDGHKLDVQFA